MTTTALIAGLSGLGFGLSLIIAIGAQNAFVLRQGIRREHIGAIVALCAASDLILICAGVAGMGQLVQRIPFGMTVVRVGGAVFLLAYAALAIRRVIRGGHLDADGGRGPGVPLSVALGTAAAITWLNPHVYLDTVILLGSVASAHHDQRWWFALGACLASLLWFTALGYGARLLTGVFARPRAWRILDGVIAAIMLTLGIRLLMG